MLTSRGWWFLSCLLVATTLAFFLSLGPDRRSGQPNFAMVCLCITLLLWFLAEWLLFSLRAHFLHRRIRVGREIHDERGPIDNLWAGRIFHIRVTVDLEGGFRLPYVSILDRQPFVLKREGQGASWFEGTLVPDNPVCIEYDVRCLHPGRVRFEGVQIRVADLQGFFHHSYFVRAPMEYRILPPLVDAEGTIATIKRMNILPPPGIHRQRRPGSGTELLDLRDYIPGDPPKTIAWKASARRDRLITKEFENEVPVRTTLFVDTSHSVRLGPPGRNPLTAIVEIASAVAQASSAARDLTGVCLFDESATTYIRPGRGQRHMIQMINTLTDAAGLRATTGKTGMKTLLPLACAVAEEVYPDLMHRHANTIPFWLPWISPKPGYTYRAATWGDWLNGWLPFIVGIFGFGGLFIFVIGLIDAIITRYTGIFSLGLVIGPLMTITMLVLGFIMNVPRRLAEYRWRKRLSAVMSVRYQLDPGGLSLLMEDDVLLDQYLQRFLIDHHVPYHVPLFDRAGRYLFASKEKVDILAADLLRAVRRGHDNELFVILADLLELKNQLEPLLRAFKVAVARHHKVMVVCPWPVGVPFPHSDEPLARPSMKYRVGLTAEHLNDLATRRLHVAVHDLRLRLAKVGVQVLCTEVGESTRLILEKIERLRMAGVR